MNIVEYKKTKFHYGLNSLKNGVQVNYYCKYSIILIKRPMLLANPNERLLSDMYPPLEDLQPESTQTPPVLRQSLLNQEIPIQSNVEYRWQNPEKHRVYKNKVQRSCLTYVLKGLNITIGSLFVMFAIFCYTSVLNTSDFQGNNKILTYVMPSYIGLSGLIILLIECRMVLMVQYMHFMYNYVGRGLFNIYAGIMPLMMIPNFDGVTAFEVVTMVASGIMVSVGLMYISLKIFCCEHEGDRIEQENRQSKSGYSD